MKGRDRWIMVFAMALAVAGIAADHIRHRPPYTSDAATGGHDEEADSPCTMGPGHEEEANEEDEL
jgi:hypothetical protein